MQVLMNSLQLINQLSSIYIMLGISRFVIGLSHKTHPCYSAGLD